MCIYLYTLMLAYNVPIHCSIASLSVIAPRIYTWAVLWVSLLSFLVNFAMLIFLCVQYPPAFLARLCKRRAATEMESGQRLAAPKEKRSKRGGVREKWRHTGGRVRSGSPHNVRAADSTLRESFSEDITRFPPLGLSESREEQAYQDVQGENACACFEQGDQEYLTETAAPEKTKMQGKLDHGKQGSRSTSYERSLF